LPRTRPGGKVTARRPPGALKRRPWSAPSPLRGLAGAGVLSEPATRLPLHPPEVCSRHPAEFCSLSAMPGGHPAKVRGGIGRPSQPACSIVMRAASRTLTLYDPYLFLRNFSFAAARRPPSRTLLRCCWENAARRPRVGDGNGVRAIQVGRVVSASMRLNVRAPRTLIRRRSGMRERQVPIPKRTLISDSIGPPCARSRRFPQRR